MTTISEKTVLKAIDSENEVTYYASGYREKSLYNAALKLGKSGIVNVDCHIRDYVNGKDFSEITVSSK